MLEVGQACRYWSVANRVFFPAVVRAVGEDGTVDVEVQVPEVHLKFKVPFRGPGDPEPSVNVRGKRLFRSYVQELE